MTTTKRKTGRPRTPIDWKQFDKLCGLQATLEEIACYFDCTVDTVERAVERDKGMRFAEYFATKRGRGKVSLRRAQFRAALAGNATMLVWLGKQWLGQKDEHHTKIDAQIDVRRAELEKLSTAQLIELAREQGIVVPTLMPALPGRRDD